MMQLLYHSVKGVYLFVHGYKRGLDGPTEKAYIRAGVPRSPLLDTDIDLLRDEPGATAMPVDVNAIAQAVRALLKTDPLK